MTAAVEKLAFEPSPLVADAHALAAAMTDRKEISDWERRKGDHRGRVAKAGRDAAAIYGADKLRGIREARDGYAKLAEDVEERLGNPLDERMRVWERDLEMLAALDPPLLFSEEIAVELERLRGDRAASPLRQ